MRRTVRVQSGVAVVALLTWTLAPGAVVAAPSLSAGRSVDAPDYFELASAVGKAGLDAALVTAPYQLIVAQPVSQAPETSPCVSWHGFDLELADIRSPPSA